MNKFFGILAVVGFALSVLMYVLSLLGMALQDSFPFSWGLHFGIFLVFIPAVFGARKKADKTDASAMVREFPSWASALVVFLFVYAIINLLASFSDLAAGSPEVKDGQYFLVNNGKIIKSLTAEEYAGRRANLLRGFSGHWMLFYAVSAVLHLCRRSPRRE